MVKTSYRFEDQTAQALEELADKCHNGNRTAALVEAIRRYHKAEFSQPSQPLGWVSVRVNKAKCAKCNSSIEGQPAFIRLDADGRLSGALHCGKCAK